MYIDIEKFFYYYYESELYLLLRIHKSLEAFSGRKF
jgi:hypothetical protein